MKNFIARCALSVILFGASPLCAQIPQGYRELRSEHFLIYYPASIDEGYVRSTADVLEGYYRDITQEFNLVRDNLWLWDNRAKVFIAADKQEYVSTFKCPSWSGACVDYRDKIIYTYPHQHNRASIFAHELTHIIFREYVGSGKLPLWLDEAAALYVESKHVSNPYARSMYLIRRAIKDNTYIKFSDLNQMRPEGLSSSGTGSVSLFYLESYSIISFLVGRYGRDHFSQFLYFLRNGSTIEDALSRSFQSIRSMSELEEKWKKFYLE
ncbi:MAG: peptidase MA family metallohydrolase [Candidatus Omnitrophota bacterium]|nr:hypothetical protein [Candidatus Omnitrophota bacterium]